MSKPKKRRSYDASRRRLRAEESRERVLDVARRLFATRGYAETTIEAIATEADVAVPTVYAAFQSKRGVLSALMARLVSGEPGAPPLLQTAGPRRVMAETDPRRMLALFVADLSGVQERVIPTYEVMKSAARTEPDVAELLARMQAYRFSNIETVPAKLAESGALRPGLSVEDAARTIWALASPEVRQMVLTFAGWSGERYRAWLEETLAAVLLPPASSGGSKPT
ncbi:MAG: TetR/AcrR family transcriptional regulator [Polyangiaceae bacterium]|nr:TetR/AcrR family transcriptional regulator [Polyangiaceae bacterium]